MYESLSTVGYLAAAILFIMSLGGLASPKTARRGNLFGMIGMALGIGVTFVIAGGIPPLTALIPLGVGATIGAFLAARVAMTSMPELVAILHSFVGLAAVLVGFATYLAAEPGELSTAAEVIHRVEIYLAVAIGAITFTGSVVAWGKLKGVLGSNPLLLPGRHALNMLMVLVIVAAAAPFALANAPAMPSGLAGILASTGPQILLILNAGVAALLGVHLVMAIGGADMPVVISLLNSYSGWAAAAAGFMLSNDLLIITGALVGSSGAILSYIMCKGMNRSLLNVVFGGFGAAKPAGAAGPKTEYGEAREADCAQVAQLLRDSQRIAIIPGYGMAVAQAQHAVSQLTARLRRDAKTVLFGIHPVAGRMPGHMNVLLAEADIPYDIVMEMEDINEEFARVDAVLVVGANDIVNPDAMGDPASPIYGMPQLEVWDAATVVVLKRSLSPGYAGVQNPLFFLENTLMYFGDAKSSIEALCDAL